MSPGRVRYRKLFWTIFSLVFQFVTNIAFQTIWAKFSLKEVTLYSQEQLCSKQLLWKLRFFLSVKYSLLIHFYHIIQSIAWLQCRSWFAKMRRATYVIYSVGRPISNVSHDPRTPTTKFAMRTAQERNWQSERNKSWFADADFCKEFIRILNKTINISGKPFPGFKPGTGGFTLFREYSTRVFGFTTANETFYPYQKLISHFQYSR